MGRRLRDIASIGPDAEVYTVRPAIWKRAGMEDWGGCLCIGCLEKRIGRRLKRRTSCATIRSTQCRGLSAC